MAYQTIKNDVRVYFGADPEVFISLDGKVVGSEFAIPETGLAEKVTVTRYSDGDVNIIRDGVQAELNVPPTFCREWLAMEIQLAINSLVKHLQANPDLKFEISFRQVIDMDPEELAKLSKLSQRLGCNPSFNWYTPGATIGVDADTYTKRSAGGHIHLGLPEHLMPVRHRLAPLLDVLLGNTSVLIDRDPGAAIRRQVYGRAGEFRLPRHGFEYRTLSNFWLRSRELVSLVTGLSRLAVFVLHTSVEGPSGPFWAADEALLAEVDLKKIEEAINNSDVALAKENFKGVRTFLERHVPAFHRAETETGLSGRNLDAFATFVAGIDEGGIEKWFPDDPITHWRKCDWMRGWESFLERIELKLV